MARPANDWLKVPSGASVYIGVPGPGATPPAPTPAPTPTLTLSASGAAVAGTSFSVTLTAANLVSIMPSVLERLSGPGLTFSPAVVNPAPGELVKLFGVVADAAGTARLRAVSGGVVSNELAFTVNAAPGPAPMQLAYLAQTPEQITLNCALTRSVAEGTLARLFYKLPSATTWTEAHPLLQVRPAELAANPPTTPVAAFKGAIFGLVPGTTYDVRVVGTEPGIGTWELTGQRATRALPPAAGAATKTATPASDLQAVVSSLVPGDVLVLADGTYALPLDLRITAVGTAAQPITIRGATRAGVILSRTTDAVVQVTTGKHTVIENLTIRGSGTDSGTAASSIGLLFWTGAVAEGITLRRVNVEAVDIGVSAPRTNQALVYECNLQGNNTWDKAYTVNPASGAANYTWNDDGLLLAGEGNCAWNCTLTGFGDATSAGHSTAGGRANYFFRLDIPMTCDDAHEGDYTDGPCGFYDNRIGNSATLFSADPVWGGPFFVFRNASANTVRGPWKLNDINYGVLLYNNTVLRNADANGFGNYQSGAGGGIEQRALAMRNNLEVVRGAVTNRFWWDCFVDRLDWTNNAYFPDGAFTWAVAPDGGGASLSAARAQLPAKTLLFGTGQRHANDIIATTNPWAETITLGATFTTQFTGTPSWALAVGSNARNAGVAVPGITDGFSGGAPDIGGVIAGRTPVEYGASTDVLPSWVPAASSTQANVTTLTVANGKLANTSISVCAPYYQADIFGNTWAAYSGGAFAPNWGAKGAMLYFGQGHSGGNNNQVVALEFGEVCTFKAVNNPSPIFGTGTDANTKYLNARGDFSYRAYTNPEGLAPSYVGQSLVDQYTAALTVDGQPPGMHSYNLMTVLAPSAGAPAGSFFIPMVAAGAYNGLIDTQSVTAYKIPLDATAAQGSRPWQQLFRHPTYPVGTALSSYVSAPAHVAYDAPSGRVFYETGNYQGVRWYDVAAPSAAAAFVLGTGTQLDRNDYASGSYATMLIEVPERRLAVMFYKRNNGFLAARWMDMSAAQPSWVNAGANITQNIEIDNDWSCVCWCADINAFIVGDIKGNRSTIAQITLPTTLTQPWVAEMVTLSQEVTTWYAPTNRTLDVANVYRKWTYVPALKCIPFFNIPRNTQPTDVVFAIRPKGV